MVRACYTHYITVCIISYLFISMVYTVADITLLYLYLTLPNTQHHDSGILDKVMREEPNHGMNWSPASKKNFTSNIDRKKDFTKVAKAMSKSTGDCQAYYYSSFKNTVSLSLSSLIHLSFVTKHQ